MGLDRIAYIKEHYDLIEYARNVLGMPVHRPGDRTISIAPNSQNPTSLLFGEDTFYDFKLGWGGDIIDLCAAVKHNGDKGEAIRELAGDFGYSPDWKEKTQQRCTQIAKWHEALRECDMHYLYRRGIKKSTVDRLLIGYDEKEDRLIIPYWKNGYPAYFVGRDRSGKPEASKYKKAYLDGYNEHVAWGLHTFEPKHRSLIEEQIIKQSKIATDTPEIATNTMAKTPISVAEKKISTEKKIRSADDRKKLINMFGIIAEGAFDALSFEQEGFKVLSPISGYFNKEALKQVITILKAQERVFVCFDSDKAGTRFTVDMCKNLFKNRINFVCGVLPEGFKDVSEYYEAGGDLFDLVENAKSGIETLAATITDEEDFKDFVYSAARFVEKPELIKLFVNTENFSKLWLDAVRETALKVPPDENIIKEILNSHNLKYLEDDGFYEYVHGVWLKRSENFIAGLFSAKLGKFTNGRKIASLDKVLKATITTDDPFNKKNLFVFKNCTLDLDRDETRPHACTDMSSIQMNYNFDINAKCPAWLKFINEVMEGRKLSIDLIQEMLGYVLYTDCSLQKCFILKGEGSNGKSVFLNVITALFNDANVSNIEMSALIEPFQRIYLKDSLVNISSETRSNVRGAESYFKQIVTGDKITACYKNKNFMTFRPRAKLIMACNDFMRTSDSDKGFIRRLIFIDFPHVFDEKTANLDLENELLSELPGIFNWTYDGYKRLKTLRKFTKTPEHETMLKEFLEVSNQLYAFIEEKIIGLTDEIERGTLYEIYTSWARNAGHEVFNRTNFTHNFIKIATLTLPSFKMKIIHGERYFVFKRTTNLDELGTDEDFLKDVND